MVSFWVNGRNRSAYRMHNVRVRRRKGFTLFWAIYAFSDMFYCIKSCVLDILVINLLLGSTSKFSCAQCHTRTQPAVSSRYDTLRTIIYRIIPPLHLITNSLITNTNTISTTTLPLTATVSKDQYLRGGNKTKRKEFKTLPLGECHGNIQIITF